MAMPKVAPNQAVLDIAARRLAEREADSAPEGPTPEELQENLAAQLDEAAAFQARHVYATPAKIDAMALVAAASHVTDVFITLPRVIFLPAPGALQQENIGKTEAMKATYMLSANPLNLAGGTWPEVRSLIFEAANAGLPCPVTYRDEVSDVFGLSGVNAQNHPIADLARRGYKRGETIGRSTGQTSARASIFGIMLMTGRKVAVPKDIRTRCLVVEMWPSPHPVEYFDERDSGAEATDLAESLGAAVQALRDPIKDFRVRKLHRPGLAGRRAEVWEALFAVASAAGQEWLNRCWLAFTEIAMTDADQPILSPNQAIIRDVAHAALALEGDGIRHQGREFMPGALLRSEMQHARPEAYASLDASALGKRMARALPCELHQVRQGDSMIKGHYADELIAAWDAIRPRELADVAIREDDDPYADEPV